MLKPPGLRSCSSSTGLRVFVVALALLAIVHFYLALPAESRYQLKWSEILKSDHPKNGDPQNDTAANDIPNIDTPKNDDFEIDAPKIDTEKIDTPKIDTPVIDIPKNDTLENDKPKTATPEIDTPKNETLKNDTPEIDTPKNDTLKIDTPAIDVDTPKNETLKIDTPAIDIPKNDTLKIDNPKNKTSDACTVFSGLDNVVITVKTGATEANIKVPPLLRTSLRCAPHVYVFSDMAQKIGDLEIYDALDTIPESVKEGNADFDIYRKQQELGDPAMIIEELHDFRNPNYPGDLAAWSLDKYKNLHIVEKSWALKPNMDWYLHIDADTYVFWSSLIEWTQRLDSSKESFFGALSYINDLPFAHGGSGIFLSNATTRNFVVTHNGTAARWDSKISDNCCGDYVLSRIMHDYGIEVQNSSPTIDGETPYTIPFADYQWCQPVMTLHHITPEEAEQLGKFEEGRQNKKVRGTLKNLIEFNAY